MMERFYCAYVLDGNYLNQIVKSIYLLGASNINGF